MQQEVTFESIETMKTLLKREFAGLVSTTVDMVDVDILLLESSNPNESTQEPMTKRRMIHGKRRQMRRKILTETTSDSISTTARV